MKINYGFFGHQPLRPQKFITDAATGRKNASSKNKDIRFSHNITFRLEAGLGSGGGISPEGSPVSGEAGAEKAPEPERQRTKEDLLRELEALEKEAEANRTCALFYLSFSHDRCFL